MGAITILIIILILVALSVGGYFAYTKLYVPKQCTGQAATSNVATWVYDSTNGCTANTCIVGYGTGSTKEIAGDPPCTPYVAPPVPNYTELQGACRSAGTGGYISTDFDETIIDNGKTTNHYTNLALSDCKAKCDASSTCTAISYPKNKDCYLFVNKTVKSDQGSNETCYQKPTTMSNYQMY